MVQNSIIVSLESGFATLLSFWPGIIVGNDSMYSAGN